MKDHFLVTGGARLVGSVKVDGAKNSVLKLMSAALLAEGTTVLRNCPDIADVPYMADVLRGLGCEVELDNGTATIHTPAEISSNADIDAVRQFRASVCVLGPLTARCHHAVVALPTPLAAVRWTCTSQGWRSSAPGRVSSTVVSSPKRTN